MKSVHNSRKNQLYTSKTYETRLCDSVHNSKKNQVYTNIANMRVFTYCDSYAM